MVCSGRPADGSDPTFFSRIKMGSSWICAATQTIIVQIADEMNKREW